MTGVLGAMLETNAVPQVRSGDASAGAVTFGSDGTVSGSTSFSVSGGLSNAWGAAWATPKQAGIGARYYLKCTKVSGPANFSGFTSFTLLTSGAVISAIGGTGACVGTWQIATDAGGTNVVGSGNLTVNNTL